MKKDELTTKNPTDAKPVLSAGWISVKEQLPECWSQHRNDYGSGYVLGYTKYGEWEITQLWNNKDWEGDDDNEGDYITHWMPLTVPPTCR
jgi:hypothetical protein